MTVSGDRNACRYTAVNKTAFCSVLNSRSGIAKTLFNKIKNNPAYKKFIKKNVIKKKTKIILPKSENKIKRIIKKTT